MTDSPYAEDACPGPCNRMYRRAIDDYQAALVIYEQARAEYEEAYEDWRAYADDSPEPVPPEPPAEPTAAHTAGDPVWCSRCAGTIRRALANLDDLASLLECWADGHRGATSGQQVGTTGPRAHSGSPSPISDTLDKLYGMLVQVEDQWRDHRNYPRRPQRARDSRARRLTIAFLLGELRDILDNPGSVRFGLGVLAWERRLQAMSTSEPIVQRRTAVRCPRCRERALRTRDDGYTQCATCGRLLNEEEYQELVNEQDDAGQTAVV